MTGRVLFYVQHLLGIGHLRRAEILVEAMAGAGLDVTVAYGGKPLREVPFEGVKVAPLPPATIANEDFSTLLDAEGQAVDEAWRTKRRDALLTLYENTDPDVLLLELFPFGRRQFGFELIPLLEKARASDRRPLVACSVRDVLVASKRPGREDEVVNRARKYFDAVLVHGDPALIPFAKTFPAAERIADLIRHTGYVVAAKESTTTTEGTGEVLVSAGGGAVGAPLLFAAIGARPLTALAGNTWRFLTGPNLPDSEFRKLAAMADDLTIVERFRTDFSARLRTCSLSISQAGYNTTMDILGAGARAVVIPYETAGETEQRLRAELLAERGLLTVLPAAELSPATLADAISKASARSAAKPAIDLAGAAKTAEIIKGFAAERPATQR